MLGGCYASVTIVQLQYLNFNRASGAAVLWILCLCLCLFLLVAQIMRIGYTNALVQFDISSYMGNLTAVVPLDGKNDEISYWEEVIGLHLRQPQGWILDVLSGKTPFPEFLNDYLVVDAEATEIKVLDVGCGPFGTIQNSVFNGRNICVTGLDPLAEDYSELLARSGLRSPLATVVAGVAETINRLFDGSSFDFVNADNSLDHCYDPRLSITNIINVLKPGRFARIKVFVNEGEYTGYSGFHQWNFDALADKIVIWNRSEIFFLDDVVEGLPYSFKKIKELTGEGVYREALEIVIYRPMPSEPYSYNLPNKIDVTFFPMLSAFMITPLDLIEDKANIFIHINCDSGDVIPMSYPVQAGNKRFCISLPGLTYSSIRIGQFTKSNNKFINLWVHEFFVAKR